jgi:hypothetical protein
MLLFFLFIYLFLKAISLLHINFSNGFLKKTDRIDVGL